MLELGQDEPQTAGNLCCQLTRVSKIAVSPQLETFAKRPKRIGFAQFQMPYGSLFNAIHKYTVGFRFRQNSFFAILFRDPRISLRVLVQGAPESSALKRFLSGSSVVHSTWELVIVKR